MTRLGVEGVDGFDVDERELARQGPTFTADTLATFPVDEELFLVLGADSASGIRTWNRWEEVMARATVIVAPRPGIDMDTVGAVLPDAMVLDCPALDISSTTIRSLSSRRGAYRFLVPEPVYRYIEEHRLYDHAERDDRVGASIDQEEAS